MLAPPPSPRVAQLPLDCSKAPTSATPSLQPPPRICTALEAPGAHALLGVDAPRPHARALSHLSPSGVRDRGRAHARRPKALQ